MPGIPPYARVLVSLGGDNPVPGPRDTAPGTQVTLSLESGDKVSVTRWEIYGYPPGFAPGAPWTQETPAGESGPPRGAPFVATTFAGSAAPPFVTAPAPSWGKYLLRATINQGLIAGAFALAAVDESSGVSVPGPFGLRDLVPTEDAQFGGPLGWAADQQTNLRLIGANLGGTGGGTGAGVSSLNTVSGALTLTGDPNINVVVNGASLGFHFGVAGQLPGDMLFFDGTSWARIGIGAAGTVFASNGTSGEWQAPASGGNTLAVTGQPALSGNVTLDPGPGIELAQTAQTIHISATGIVTPGSGFVRYTNGVRDPNGASSVVDADIATSANILVGKLAPSARNGDVISTINGIVQWSPPATATSSGTGTLSHPIVDSDVSPTAAIALSKLAAVGNDGQIVTRVSGVLQLANAPASTSGATSAPSGTGLVRASGTGTFLSPAAPLSDNDVASNAAIALSKLSAASGTDNQYVKRVNGVLQLADAPSGLVVPTSTVPQGALFGSGASPNGIAAPRPILETDISPAARIEISKIAGATYDGQTSVRVGGFNLFAPPGAIERLVMIPSPGQNNEALLFGSPPFGTTGGVKYVISGVLCFLAEKFGGTGNVTISAYSTAGANGPDGNGGYLKPTVITPATTNGQRTYGLDQVNEMGTLFTGQYSFNVDLVPGSSIYVRAVTDAGISGGRLVFYAMGYSYSLFAQLIATRERTVMLGFRKIPVPYDPSLTTGLRAWWDPDYGLTNTAGHASALLDKAGNGYTASYPTAASQPAIVTGAVNGHTVLSFAANQVLDTPLLGLTGDVAATLFACIKPSNTTTPYALFGFGATGTALAAFGMWLNAAGANQLSLECGGGNGARFTCPISAGWQVFVIRKPAGPLNTAIAYQNGTQLAVASAPATTPNVSTSGVRLGCWAPDSVGNLFSGQMGPVGIYNGDIGDAEALKLSSFYKSALLIP